MNGHRTAVLQQAYRDLHLKHVDRRPRRTGGASNLRRRLKQFWTKRGRLPEGAYELLQFDGLSERAAWELCAVDARAGGSA